MPHNAHPEESSSKSPGVLCSGSIVFDTLVWPVQELRWGTTSFVESVEYHAGGNGANTSIALATLGTPVRLLGTLGSDDQARFIRLQLDHSGVDTNAIVACHEPTAASVVFVNANGDRGFLHRIGASGNAFTEPIVFTAAITNGMSHYHLASLFILPQLRQCAAATLAGARAAGLSTSLDTNWDPRGRWLEDLAPCLLDLDLLFINEDEARMVTGSSDPKSAAHFLLDRGVRIAVMKLGQRGCAVYSANLEIVCPAFEVDVKDTTGAGDCFVAGFLAARLRGASLAEAGHFANAVGAHSVQAMGAVAGVPSYTEITAWMKSARLRSDLNLLPAK